MSGIANAQFAWMIVAIGTIVATSAGSVERTPPAGTACTPADQLCLTVGLAVANGDPAQCGVAESLVVNQRDQINVCYTVTNASGRTLNYHWLRDSVDGALFNQSSIVLADGAAYQYNRIVTAEETRDITSTWTAAPTLPYEFSTGTYDFIDISATGTEIAGGDDDMSAVTLPFPVNFYGETDQLCIGNNGSIVFGSATCYLPGFNVALPIIVPNYFGGPVLFPMWTDLYSGGQLLVQQVGTSPNSKFVVEWYQKNHYNDGVDDPGGVTFEVVFDEASGNFSFQYQTTTFGSDPAWDHGGSATVGVENAEGSSWNQFSYNEPVLVDESAIDWTDHSDEALSAVATVHVDVGAPIADIAPATLDATAAIGMSTTATLTIGNPGDRDLTWNFEEASARAHFPPPGSRYALPFHGAAETSKGRPPRPPGVEHGNDRRHAQRALSPLGAGAVPAYAIVYSLEGSYFETFDAANPTGFDRIAFYDGQTYAGAFVGDDFTREYVLSYNTSQLDALDTLTGDVTHIAALPLPPNESWSSLSWDRTTNTLYGLASKCGTSTSIYTIDPSTGAYQLVGTTTEAACMVAMAVDDDGLMYGLDLIQDALYAIDKTSGESALIGSVGFNANYAQDIAFDRSTGVLYLGGMDNDANGGIYTIDTVTGMATLTEPLGYLVEVTALDIAVAGGPCAHVSDIPWLTQNPLNGSTPANSSSPVDVTFDAASLAVGSYSATACVRTNDHHRRTVGVPVRFTVSDAADMIFADGFDGGR
jgi:hypothetical protein